MGPAFDIKKLCESWWEKVADTTKSEQHRFAEQFLTLLGWDDAAPIALPGAAVKLATVSYLIRAGSHDSLAAHFVMPGALEPPGNLVERGLDFCETTRILADATRALNVGYAFITDLFRSYLYDVFTDELLLYSDSPAAFQQDFGAMLSKTDVERGAIGELRRQPRSVVARHLREWVHRWCRVLMAESKDTEEHALFVMDRLLVLRYLIDHDIFKRSGSRLQRRFQEVLEMAAGPRPEGCGKALVRLFHDIWLDWKTDFFAAQPLLDPALERDHVAGPMLREFAMLSRAKFHIATILESFNYGDAGEKARVRMIPEDTEERTRYLGKQTVDTIDTACIEIDLSEEGYRSLFHWYDHLTALYEHLERVYDARQVPAAPGTDLDLLSWSEVDARRPSALTDKLLHAAERGLRIYYTTPRQLRTARLLLLLHIISRYGQSKVRFAQFPKLEATFQHRPRVLETDRRLIFGGHRQELEGELL